MDFCFNAEIEPRETKTKPRPSRRTTVMKPKGALGRATYIPPSNRDTFAGPGRETTAGGGFRQSAISKAQLARKTMQAKIGLFNSDSD